MGSVKALAKHIGGDKFPIYWVPQRVGRQVLEGTEAELVVTVSNLLGSPASGEFVIESSPEYAQVSFQFIGFPSEWGDTPIETRMARACQGAFASISPNRYTLYCF